MKLLKLSEAAKLPGAPTRQALALLTKKKNTPDFVCKDEGIWKVDVDSADWQRYLAQAAKTIKSAKSITTGEGVALPRKEIVKETPKDIPQELINLVLDREEEEARLAHYKANLEEIKYKSALESYVDKSLMGYYFSFVDRLISESFATVKRTIPKLEEHYKEKDLKAAEKKMLAELQKTYEVIKQSLKEEFEEENDND